MSEQAAELALPFDAYKLDDASTLTVEAAQDVLLRDCMQRRGMRWTLLPRTEDQGLDPPNRRRYGVIEAEVARGFGYHPPPEPVGEARHAALRDRRDNGLSDDDFRAAYGKDGLGGCWKRAGAALQQGIPDGDDSRFDDLDEKAYTASQRDAEVIRAVRTWRGCMKDAGFHYDHPLKPARDPRWRKADRPSPAKSRRSRRTCAANSGAGS